MIHSTILGSLSEQRRAFSCARHPKVTVRAPFQHNQSGSSRCHGDLCGVLLAFLPLQLMRTPLEAHLVLTGGLPAHSPRYISHQAASVENLTRSLDMTGAAHMLPQIVFSCCFFILAQGSDRSSQSLLQQKSAVKHRCSASESREPPELLPVEQNR